MPLEQGREHGSPGDGDHTPIGAVPRRRIDSRYPTEDLVVVLAKVLATREVPDLGSPEPGEPGAPGAGVRFKTTLSFSVGQATHTSEVVFLQHPGRSVLVAYNPSDPSEVASQRSPLAAAAAFIALGAALLLVLIRLVGRL